MDSSYLADRIALQDVMLNYANAVDDRDIARYRSCFMDQVEIVGFGQQTFTSRDDWINYVWTALENYSSTQHLLSPMHCDISNDTASTRSNVQALHYMKEDPDTRFTLWATYKTEMKKVDSHWKISRHELLVRGSETVK